MDKDIIDSKDASCMYRIILIIVAIIFIIAALTNLVTDPNFGGMSPPEKNYVIRFIVSIGLFIGGFIGFITLKNWIIFGILGLAAFTVLFSSC